MQPMYLLLLTIWNFLLCVKWLNILWKPDALTLRFVSSMMNATMYTHKRTTTDPAILNLFQALQHNVIIRCFHVNFVKHLIIKINLRVTLNAIASIQRWCSFCSLPARPRRTMPLAVFLYECLRVLAVAVCAPCVAAPAQFSARDSTKYRKLFVSIES